jgi:hypothetical protein
VSVHARIGDSSSSTSATAPETAISSPVSRRTNRAHATAVPCSMARTVAGTTTRASTGPAIAE